MDIAVVSGLRGRFARVVCGDMELSASQRERVAATLEFARARLGFGQEAHEPCGGFDRTRWEAAAHFGLAGLPIPGSFGGGGLDAVDTMLVVGALGRGCADDGLVLSLCAHTFAAAVPIWRSRSQDHQLRFLRDVAHGKLLCASAPTESEPSADADVMCNIARRAGGACVLRGTKRCVINAPVADLFVVYATAERSPDLRTTSAFLVPRDSPGLHVVPEQSGLSEAAWGTLVLDDCVVPEAMRLGAEGAGTMLLRESLLWQRGCLLAYSIGALERRLEHWAEHARSRRQLELPSGKQAEIGQRLAGMRARLEAAHLLLLRAGDLHRKGKPSEEAIAMSRLFISEAALQASIDAAHILGVDGGASCERSAGASLRDAIPTYIFSGSSEAQRAVVARAMGLA